jgi:hypothetical protein
MMNLHGGDEMGWNHDAGSIVPAATGLHGVFDQDAHDESCPLIFSTYFDAGHKGSKPK